MWMWLVAEEIVEACMKVRDNDMCVWRWMDPEIQIQGLLNEEETLEVLYY
jgi:hypothetical protein